MDLLGHHILSSAALRQPEKFSCADFSAVSSAEVIVDLHRRKSTPDESSAQKSDSTISPGPLPTRETAYSIRSSRSLAGCRIFS